MLFVRDLASEEFARKMFDCRVNLCPDIAFALNPLSEENSPIDTDILWLARRDSETAHIPRDIDIPYNLNIRD
ncbi:MAG: hypothetical protein IT292_04245 [Deltaproteobacteria bacterium]|nr:hypothetical protein [Deltaproteobacteria bacterium]